MAQHGVKEVMDFTIAKFHPDPYKREPIFHVDYATITDVENGGERIDISGGRGNSRLLSFDHSKTVALNVTLPLVDLKVLAEISGDDVEEQVKDVFKREEICTEYDSEAGSAYIELSKTPIEGSVYVYILEGYIDNGEPFKKAESAGALKADEFSVADKKVTLGANVNTAGVEMVVFYHTKTNNPVTTMAINPVKFPRAISFYGDTLFRDRFTEEDEVYNVVGHKARIRPEYTLGMNATDVATIELTLDMYGYKSPCSGRIIYLEYIKEEEAE